jgi:hypothetical protein
MQALLSPAVRARRRLARAVGPYIVGQRPVAKADPVMIGIGDGVQWGSDAHDEAARRGVAFVLKTVANRIAGTESRGIPGAQKRLRVALGQCHLTFEDIDHLILRAVPVLDRRPGAWGQYLDEGAKLGEAAGLADPQPPFRAAGVVYGVFLHDHAIGRDDGHRGSLLWL